MANDDERAAALFERLVAEHAERPDVLAGPIWHNLGLKVHGKTYAMFQRGRLVVKVPAAQAAELVASGAGVPMEPKPGRPMREWVSLPPPTPRARPTQWRALMDDAHDYVAALATGRVAPIRRPSRPRRSKAATGR